MIIKVVRERKLPNGAIPGRVFVDNVFFSYSLENADSAIPTGTYDIYAKYSPSFKANKVYIDVPGRTNILFHGGNTPADSKGCVLLGARRTAGDRIEGDQSAQLFEVISDVIANGDRAAVVVQNDRAALVAAGLLFLGLLIFNSLKKGR